MASSGMLHRVALVRTDVSEELRASFIMMTTIGELGTMLAVTSITACISCCLQLALFLVHRFLSPGGAKFLRNVGSYKSHMA
jgi:hypothetical protein